jgi:general secretion pathway protein K
VRRERGVAALTAILIVAVAASAATYMLAQQSAMVDQATLIASRAQADHYLDAGLDWARGVLAEDAKRAGNVDSLGEGWAQPIMGLPVERAVVAGAIQDEQGKFNLNNLAERNDTDLRLFQRLLKSLGLPVELADAVVDWVDADDTVTGAGGAENSYYLSLKRPYRAANQRFVQVDELHRVRGFDPKAVALLRPHVSALPGRRTTINVNTASAVLLDAVFDGKVPRDALAERAAQRRSRPFQSANEISTWASRADPAILSALDVKSSYFAVRVQVAQDDVHVAADALMQRSAQGAVSVAWRRPLY